MLDNSSKYSEVLMETMLLHAIKLIVQQKLYKEAVHFHTVATARSVPK